MFHFFGYWSVEVHGMTLLDLFEIHSRGQNVQFQRKNIRMHDDVDKDSAKKGYLIWTHEWIESDLGKCFSKCFNGFVVVVLLFSLQRKISGEFLLPIWLERIFVSII